MASYEWRNGSRVCGIDANVAGTIMHELSGTDEGLTPKTLLNASRSDDAPLHKYFEWDDTKAAEGYRESQAAHMIRSIEIKIEKIDIPVRAFAPVFVQDTDTSRMYKRIDYIVSRPNLVQSVMQDALNELKALQAKYTNLGNIARMLQPVIDMLSIDIIDNNRCGKKGEKDYGSQEE